MHKDLIEKLDRGLKLKIVIGGANPGPHSDREKAEAFVAKMRDQLGDENFETRKPGIIASLKHEIERMRHDNQVLIDVLEAE